MAMKKNLWIPDGMHSVHIVAISEENFKAKIDYAKLESNLLGTTYVSDSLAFVAVDVQYYY